MDPPKVRATLERRHVWVATSPEVWQRFDDIVVDNAVVKERLLGVIVKNYVEGMVAGRRR